MELCLRKELHKDGKVFESTQVLQNEEEEGKSWGHRRFKGLLEFQPSGILLGKFLALCCDLDPTNRGHGHRSGWRARYQITPSGHLQLFDFADLGPEEEDFSELPLTRKEIKGAQMCRKYVSTGSEEHRLEVAQGIMATKFEPSVFHGLDLKRQRLEGGVTPCFSDIFGGLRYKFHSHHQLTLSSWPRAALPPELPHPEVEVPEGHRGEILVGARLVGPAGFQAMQPPFEIGAFGSGTNASGISTELDPLIFRKERDDDAFDDSDCGSPVCCYHLQGRCHFGDMCDFSHDDTRFGPCQFGDDCWLGHGLGF